MKRNIFPQITCITSYTLIIITINVLFFIFDVTLSIAQIADTSKYGFEEWEMGWVVQDYQTVKGASGIKVNNRVNKIGKYSLEITLNLKGATEEYPKRHPTHNSGEVYVNLLQNPPENMEGEIIGPINLEGDKISCWVYVPRDVEAGGDSHHPNGVQLFAKSVINLGEEDEKWCSKYGSWKDLCGKEGRWFKIFLTIDETLPYGGFMENCFDPTRIGMIGVKFAIGDSSRAYYEGPAYIDAVEWE